MEKLHTAGPKDRRRPRSWRSRPWNPEAAIVSGPRGTVTTADPWRSCSCGRSKIPPSSVGCLAGACVQAACCRRCPGADLSHGDGWSAPDLQEQTAARGLGVVPPAWKPPSGGLVARRPRKSADWPWRTHLGAVSRPRPRIHTSGRRARGGRTSVRASLQTAADTIWPPTQPGPVCRTPAVRRAIVPEAADGQSADRSGSLQLPLLFLKAGPAGGLRPPPGDDPTVTGEPASPSASGDANGSKVRKPSSEWVTKHSTRWRAHPR
jgi:hypothetical protein